MVFFGLSWCQTNICNLNVCRYRRFIISHFNVSPFYSNQCECVSILDSLMFDLEGKELVIVQKILIWCVLCGFTYFPSSLDVCKALSGFRNNLRKTFELQRCWNSSVWRLCCLCLLSLFCETSFKKYLRAEKKWRAIQTAVPDWVLQKPDP